MSDEFYRWVLTMPRECGVYVTKIHRGYGIEFTWAGPDCGSVSVLVSWGVNVFAADAFVAEAPKWIEGELDNIHRDRGVGE